MKRKQMTKDNFLGKQAIFLGIIFVLSIISLGSVIVLQQQINNAQIATHGQTVPTFFCAGSASCVSEVPTTSSTNLNYGATSTPAPTATPIPNNDAPTLAGAQTLLVTPTATTVSTTTIATPTPCITFSNFHGWNRGGGSWMRGIWQLFLMLINWLMQILGLGGIPGLGTTSTSSSTGIVTNICAPTPTINPLTPTVNPLTPTVNPLTPIVTGNILTPAVNITPTPTPVTGSTSTTTSSASMDTKHIVGGFSAGEYASIAQSLGVNAILNYNYDPVPGDTRSKTLSGLNMSIIDDMPDQYMRQFKSDGNLDSLLSKLQAHLKNVQNNPQVIGYWMIDDWESNYGGAKIALQKMNALIHQYTPGKYSICGFSGNTSYSAQVTQNFSPEGCDMVGIYYYPSKTGDFTMANKLPAIFSGLKAQGWSIGTTPLIGVPQSYGGANGYSIPSASQIETQVKTFCQNGAKGIIFYDFHTGQSASNNSTIQQGIKQGVSACKSIWGG